MEGKAVSEQLPPSPTEVVLKEMRDSMRRMFGMSELTIPQANIVYTDDPEYADKFPAYFEPNRDSSLTLRYHQQAIEDLVESYNEPSLYRFVERLYIGGGLLVGALYNQAMNLDLEGRNTFYEHTVNVQPLCDAVRKSELVPDQAVATVQEALIMSDDVRKIAITFQRFAVGVCAFVYDETQTLETLKPHAQNDLLLALRDYRQSFALTLGATSSRNEAQDIANMRFRDAISEFTLALCFPMGVEEIKATLDAIQDNGNGFDGHDVLDPRDLGPGGFHYE